MHERAAIFLLMLVVATISIGSTSAPTPAVSALSFATLLVNGWPEKATKHLLPLGRESSSVRVVVGAGDTVRVQAAD